jgi:hypothetical protein
MKTGSHLRIHSNFGDDVLGVTLEGNPKKPEPNSFRVQFPGGNVDIERCTDGSYWVHVLCNQREKTIDREGPESGVQYAYFSEARMHMTTKHTCDANLGDFENPGLYDVALRIVREK